MVRNDRANERSTQVRTVAPARNSSFILSKYTM